MSEKKWTARNSTLRPGKPPRRRRSLRSEKRLNRGPGPKRSKRLRPVNPERKARLEREQYGDYADEMIRGKPCHVCEAPSVAAHARKTRGASGKAEHLNRLCPSHEIEVHAIGVLSFERKYDLDLALLAFQLHREWTERQS